MANNDCPRDQELTLYLSQDLAAGDLVRIGEHLHECHDCSHRLATLQKPLSALREARLEISPFESRQFGNRVVDAAQARRTPGRLKAWGAAAATVAAGLIAILILNTNQVPVRNTPPEPAQYAELDLVEDLEMLEHLELLESMEVLEMMEGQG